jgi:hypothetical protein
MMTATLTDGTTTVAAIFALTHEASRESRNVIHNIIGRPDPDVSLAPAGLRTGTLQLLFPALADALACESLAASGVPLTYTDTEQPSSGMRFVLTGTVRRTLDPQARKRWTVDVPFQEVSA